MEITEKLLEEITSVFRSVDYGRITFYINPENKSLNYSVETTHKLQVEQPPARRVVVKRSNNP
jgi:hypothetical protein